MSMPSKDTQRLARWEEIIYMKLKNSGDPSRNVMTMVKNRTKRNGKPGFIKAA